MNFEKLRMGVLTDIGKPVEGGRHSIFTTSLKTENPIRQEEELVSVHLKPDMCQCQILREIFCAIIGRALDLRIPEPFLAVLDEDKVEDRFYFASSSMPYNCLKMQLQGKKEDDPGFSVLFDSVLKMLANSEDGALGCFFDELICNDDRNIGNLLIESTKKLWFIDHELTMQPYSVNRLAKKNLLALAADHSRVSCSYGDAIKTRHLPKIMNYNAENLLAAAQVEDYYSDMKEARDIANYILERIHCLELLLSKRFPNNSFARMH